MSKTDLNLEPSCYVTQQQSAMSAAANLCYPATKLKQWQSSSSYVMYNDTRPKFTKISPKSLKKYTFLPKFSKFSPLFSMKSLKFGGKLFMLQGKIEIFWQNIHPCLRPIDLGKKQLTLLDQKPKTHPHSYIAAGTLPKA